MHRRLLPLLLVPALLVGACGDEEDTRDTGGGSATGALEGTEPADQEVLDAVEVTEGEDGEAPTFEFEQPFAVETTARRILEEGDGDEVVEGSTVQFDFVFVNGRDGAELSSSFGQPPQSLTVDDQLMAGARLALLGLREGSRSVTAVAPSDAFEGQGDDEASGIKETDSLLLYVALNKVLPTRAEGDAVEPAEGLPTVELAEDGTPTITVPGGEPPAELVVQPLIEGAGDTVESGQAITVHYTGVLWEGGEPFDSSWETGTPATFSIGTGAVVPGWDKGLVGQKVGSQVLLVVPPADGYGAEGRDPIPGGATLVFVVDILDATDAAEAAG